MVKPTICGIIVEERDQVLITVFWPERMTVSTFFISFSLTAGPFFIDLDILPLYIILLTSALYNHSVRGFWFAGFIT